MSDRICGLSVTLEREIREDDIQPLLTAIQQMRGVAKVEMQVANSDHYFAKESAKFELRQKVVKALEGILWPEFGKKEE